MNPLTRRSRNHRKSRQDFCTIVIFGATGDLTTRKLMFQTKNPGAVVCLRTVTMDFYHQQNHSGPIFDAYARALIDCMLRDRSVAFLAAGRSRTLLEVFNAHF